MLGQENRILKSEMDDLKVKLNDKTSQLQQSEEMVDWLNRQMNDPALHSDHHQGGLKNRRTWSFAPSLDCVRTRDHSIPINSFPFTRSFSSEVGIAPSAREQA